MAVTFSVLLFLAICNSCFCQRLKVGDVASKIDKCRAIFSTKIGCPDIYDPVCAVVNAGEYINSPNDCEFCVQYGNLSALVVQIGTTGGPLQCAPFEEWSKASDDPYCKYIKTSGQRACTREYNPICGTLDDKPFIGSNKCEFCKEYGDQKVTIVTIGTPCTELKIGDVVRDNEGCSKLTGTKSACTLDYNPICAYDYKTFMQGTNFCDFCQKYGNSTGIVVQMGLPNDGGDFNCKALSVGDKANDAPHCDFVCKTWQKQCMSPTTPPKYVCAELNGEKVNAVSTCQFCKDYGCTEALVNSIGPPCE